jgi:hypothetical protein
MFGYVRAREDSLSTEALAGYEAVYCGLCRIMGERYGNFSRLFLNYDFAFLAMLLAPAGQSCVTGCQRCLPHPIQGKPTCESGEWLEVAAGKSVILTYWKLRDTVADGGFFSRLGARLLSAFLRPAYRRARSEYPTFDAQVIRHLDELRRLEGENCPSIDRTADCFAQILRSAAPETGDSGKDRALEQLLYHLGRWIYLVDGVDDRVEDQQAGRYNPVMARFPDWTEEDSSYLRNSMDHSLALAGAAFQLLEPNAWTPALENILYSGLPGVEELVFSGQWREYQKKQKHRRNDL